MNLQENGGSKRYSLNREDLKRIAVGASVAIGGAALTYLSDVIPNIDWGEATPIVVAAFSVLVNMIRKWMTDTR